MDLWINIKLEFIYNTSHKFEVRKIIFFNVWLTKASFIWSKIILHNIQFTHIHIKIIFFYFIYILKCKAEFSAS